VRARPNLRVITGALAERVLFDGKRAVGVAFREFGQSRTIRAAREVILCGGAVNSPQLLLLSGVGPQDQLAQFGVPVVHHLPGVGHSLQDHYSAPIKLKCRLPITVNDVMQSSVKKLKVGLQYYLFRTGPLTMAAGPAALFVRTREGLATPDVKISVAPFSSDRLQDGLHPWSGFGLTAYQLRPESRGEIRLKSANPSDPPAMHPNYLATETDRRALVDGLKIGRRVLATSYMQHFIAEEYQPGPSVQTDEQLLEHARNTGGTVFHPTSTCKMGVDPMAVVDPELRVHGIEGVRVVDASIMPTVISGNTNAATIMIGEKAADLVRRQQRMAA
jgi:choline dehydrogenase